MNGGIKLSDITGFQRMRREKTGKSRAEIAEEKRKLETARAERIEKNDLMKKAKELKIRSPHLMNNETLKARILEVESEGKYAEGDEHVKNEPES